MALFADAIVLIALAILYFLPCFIVQGKPQSDGVFILNLMLGWTFLGWVVALAWAVTGEKVK